MKQEEIYLIITKYLAGETTEDEDQLLESWQRESESNRSQFSELRRLWDSSNRLKLNIEVDTESGWNNVLGQITNSTDVKPIRRFIYYRVAAALLVLMVLGGVIYMSLGSQESVHQTGLSERKHIVLPDKSEVWLNQNSILEYKDDFYSRRALSLSGEAFFDVQSDPSRPFTVETNGMLTTVLGTSFKVSAKESAKQHQVTVSTGKVKVATSNANSSQVILEPGTTAIFDKNAQKLIKSSNQDMNFLAWKERKLNFRNSPLITVEKTLEEYFNVNLQFNEALSTCQFTGEFDDPTIEEVLEVLSISLDISFTKVQNQYLLQGAGCEKTENE